MKILEITGSPRPEKSSRTALAADAFVAGMKGEGTAAANADSEAAEVRRFNIYSKEIADCISCYGCWRKPRQGCMVSDDFQEFYEDLFWAERIVWSFPLYWFGMPAGDKAALDRLFCLLLPHIYMDGDVCKHPQSRQLPPITFVVTCGYPRTENNIDAVRLQLCSAPALGCPALFCVPEAGYLTVPGFERYAEPLMAKIKTAGGEFAATGRLKKETEAQLSEQWLPEDLFLETHNGWANKIAGPEIDSDIRL